MVLAHQELGGLGVGLQRVGGDDHPGQVEWGQQVRRAAVGACPAGAAQGRAVGGDRPCAISKSSSPSSIVLNVRPS